MKTRTSKRSASRYWQRLTDAELLNAPLTTDDPERLEGLVTVCPEGDEEVYVEFSYDFRGTVRDKLVCVHGHHEHLAGFVMRKGGVRYLVGWRCGYILYGEDFKTYKADFDAAKARQALLFKKKDIQDQLAPFMEWIEQTLQSKVLKSFGRIRQQLQTQMPWIWENILQMEIDATLPQGVRLPRSLFDPASDPEADLAKVAADTSALAARWIALQNIGDKELLNLKRSLVRVLTQTENVLRRLEEVTQFFQPVVLERVCECANQSDNPTKRSYTSGLMAISCKRDRGKCEIRVPADYQVPDRQQIAALQSMVKS